jgi:hypothetical protein
VLTKSDIVRIGGMSKMIRLLLLLTLMDCKSTSNILNRLKIDNTVDLKPQQKQWVNQLKQFGTKIVSPIPAQRMTGYRTTLKKIEGPRNPWFLKGTGLRAKT